MAVIYQHCSTQERKPILPSKKRFFFVAASAFSAAPFVINSRPILSLYFLLPAKVPSRKANGINLIGNRYLTDMREQLTSQPFGSHYVFAQLALFSPPRRDSSFAQTTKNRRLAAADILPLFLFYFCFLNFHIFLDQKQKIISSSFTWDFWPQIRNK